MCCSCWSGTEMQEPIERHGDPVGDVPDRRGGSVRDHREGRSRGRHLRGARRPQPPVRLRGDDPRNQLDQSFPRREHRHEVQRPVRQPDRVQGRQGRCPVHQGSRRTGSYPWTESGIDINLFASCFNFVLSWRRRKGVMRLTCFLSNFWFWE